MFIYTCTNHNKIDQIVYKNIWKQYLKLYLTDEEFEDFCKIFDIYMVASQQMPYGDTGTKSIRVYLWDSKGYLARVINCMVISHELIHGIAIYKYCYKNNNPLIARAIHQTLHYYHGYGREGEMQGKLTELKLTVKVNPLSIPLKILGSYEMIDYIKIERIAIEHMQVN
jgi:hypothetical protein